MKVKLDDVLFALYSLNDEYRFYYDITSESIVLSCDVDVEERCDELIGLPNSYDINGYDIMRNFIYTLDDEKQREDLLSAINGRGAFRCFKDKIYYFKLEKLWFDYRDKCYIEIAREWCENRHIELIEN